jgi:hypothetical protein
LSDQGRGAEAEEMHLQVVEGRKRMLGKEHSDTLTAITNLAVALDIQQKYSEAEALHREALKVKRWCWERSMQTRWLVSTL